jgi:sulfur relay (sulfurtransferase) complex TusBCD TusD component (DsrE family)
MSASPPSIFLGVMGAPFESELVTTLLRLVSEAVSRGYHVTVYACGGATGLTLTTLRDAKPPNMLDEGTPRETAVYPTTARLIEELITKADRRLRWHVCLPCMDERGALDQSELVTLDFPFKLASGLAESDVALMMGVK